MGNTGCQISRVLQKRATHNLLAPEQVFYFRLQYLAACGEVAEKRCGENILSE